MPENCLTLLANSEELRVKGYRFLLVAFSKCRTAVSNLSRHPGLQNPTTWPSYLVSESACTGLPDQGQVSLTQSAISSSIFLRLWWEIGCWSCKFLFLLVCFTQSASDHPYTVVAPQARELCCPNSDTSQEAR